MLIHAHLEGYQPGGLINVSGGKKLIEIIALLFTRPQSPSFESELRRAWKNHKTSFRDNNPDKPKVYVTLNKPSAALPNSKNSDVRAWLEHQEAYTLHRSVRKRYLRNPYTVTNRMDVWRVIYCICSTSQNSMRYILSVIDVFSKYVHLVPVKTKSGPSVTSTFRSLFHDDDSRRPVWVHKTRAKNF